MFVIFHKLQIHRPQVFDISKTGEAHNKLQACRLNQMPEHQVPGTNVIKLFTAVIYELL